MFDFIGGVTRRLGWKESQEHGVSLRSSEIRINDPYKVGPKKKVLNGVNGAPYKWPKRNGRNWGYFTPISGVISYDPTYNW